MAAQRIHQSWNFSYSDYIKSPDEETNVSEIESQIISPYPIEVEEEQTEILDWIDKSTDAHQDIISKDGKYKYIRKAKSDQRRVLALKYFLDKPCKQVIIGLSNTLFQGISRKILQKITSPFATLETFLTPDIIDQILNPTNSVLENQLSENYFLLYIGALVLFGISKSKNASIEEMFTVVFGIPYIWSRSFILFK